MARIAIAMSGGVDSSCAALLLHEAGEHELHGITLDMWDHGDGGARSAAIVARARAICEQLAIPHHVFNVRSQFRHVVDDFIMRYGRGETPNPCLVCNRLIKFGMLLRWAQESGFDMLATRHYAQIHHDADGTPSLWRAHDSSRDQSYVLYQLSQTDLAHLTFPLGNSLKADIRQLARARGLINADVAESQDICFIPDNDYVDFLHSHAPDIFQPGPIVDETGREIGQHHGLPHYTIGQRKRLGNLKKPQPIPMVVIALDPSGNRVIVSDSEAIWRRTFVIAQTHFIDGTWPTGPRACDVQIRARAPVISALISPLAAGVMRVEGFSSFRAVAPGQAAVLYDGNRVLGGGIITRTEPMEEPNAHC